jgi:predicted nucleic acid-binding Zn ribbon protein
MSGCLECKKEIPKCECFCSYECDKKFHERIMKRLK